MFLNIAAIGDDFVVRGSVQKWVGRKHDPHQRLVLFGGKDDIDVAQSRAVFQVLDIRC